MLHGDNEYVQQNKIDKTYGKTDEELFTELYESEDILNIEDINFNDFIEYCEKFYGMSTKEFRKWFENEGYEGNVAMQQWYHFTKPSIL